MFHNITHLLLKICNEKPISAHSGNGHRCPFIFSFPLTGGQTVSSQTLTFQYPWTDNITLGYSFDQLFTEKLNGRVSFTVQNAFVITKYSGLDPEVTNGIDNNIYPRPRTFMLGVNLNF